MCNAKMIKIEVAEGVIKVDDASELGTFAVSAETIGIHGSYLPESPFGDIDIEFSEDAEFEPGLMWLQIGKVKTQVPAGMEFESIEVNGERKEALIIIKADGDNAPDFKLHLRATKERSAWGEWRVSLMRGEEQEPLMFWKTF